MKKYRVHFYDWYETYEIVIKSNSKEEAIAFVENIGSIRNVMEIKVISVEEIEE